jgi:hypothetical protein
MLSYFIGLFWGFVSGTLFGYYLNFFKNLYRRYQITRDPKRILIEHLYNHITNKVFEDCYENIEVFVNENMGEIIKQIPDINDLTKLSNNLLELSKYYNNKFTIVYDNKNDKTIKIKLLNNDILEDKAFIDTMTFLNNNNIKMCIIKNESIPEEFNKKLL